MNKHIVLKQAHYFLQYILASGGSIENLIEQLSWDSKQILAIVNQQSTAITEQQFNQLLGLYSVYLCQTTFKNHQATQRLDAFKQVLQKQPCNKPKQFSLLKAIAQQGSVNSSRLAIINIRNKQSFLTRREQQVLYYLNKSYTHQQIAKCLGLSKRTIEFHWQSIKRRLHIHSLQQLNQCWQVFNAEN